MCPALKRSPRNVEITLPAFFRCSALRPKMAAAFPLFKEFRAHATSPGEIGCSCPTRLHISTP